MTKKKPQKPTAKQVSQALVNLMQETQMLNQKYDFLFNSFSHYIEYNEDSDKFAKYMEKMVEEINKEKENVKQGVAGKDTK